MKYALQTDTGRERENNEDAARAVEDLGLFVIADGMGGHVAGEVASRVAVETVISFIGGHGITEPGADEARLLSEALFEANSAVLHEAESRKLQGMGTTLTAVRVHGQDLTVCHVGDTRAYILGKAGLEVLTQDHTVVGMLVEEGLIAADAAKDHPERHMLTQAVGTQELLEPDVVQTRIPQAGRVLLSTDGLHDVVSEEEMFELGSDPDIERAARGLIERANEHGGPDNITVILIEP